MLNKYFWGLGGSFYHNDWLIVLHLIPLIAALSQRNCRFNDLFSFTTARAPLKSSTPFLLRWSGPRLLIIFCGIADDMPKQERSADGIPRSLHTSVLASNISPHSGQKRWRHLRALHEGQFVDLRAREGANPRAIVVFPFLICLLTLSKSEAPITCLRLRCRSLVSSTYSWACKFLFCFL